MSKISTKNMGERLKNLLIEKYGLHGKSPKLSPFIKDLNKSKGYRLDADYISASALSDICNGKKRFTNEHAEAFADVLGVQAEYLLCLTDFPTEDDRIQADMQKKLEDNEHKWDMTYAVLQIISDSFKKQGYTIKMCAPDKMPDGYAFKNKYAYYLIKDDSKPIIINTDDYFRLVNDILEYSEFKTQKMIDNLS